MGGGEPRREREREHFFPWSESGAEDGEEEEEEDLIEHLSLYTHRLWWKKDKQECKIWRQKNNEKLSQTHNMIVNKSSKFIEYIPFLY